MLDGHLDINKGLAELFPFYAHPLRLALHTIEVGLDIVELSLVGSDA